MTTFVLPQKKKPESAKTVLAQKPVKKTEKKPVIKHEKKAESPEKIAEPEIVAAEKPPEPVLLSDFAPLVRHSLYDGFHYSNRMAVVRHACKGAAIPGDNAVPECWEARGKGGVLSYNIHDPRALPPYFTKVTDYELSRKLRHYLGMVDIEILVLRGNRQGAQDMTIQGRDAQNNPLYIELSVSGLGE